MKTLVAFLILLAVFIWIVEDATASTSQAPVAGKFYREGMEGMYQIGIRMPMEGAASMRMLGCRVTAKHATCRLRIRQHGVPACLVRMNLRRRWVGYPLRSWHCPDEWRPQALRRMDLLRGQQLKAATS